MSDYLNQVGNFSGQSNAQNYLQNARSEQPPPLTLQQRVKQLEVLGGSYQKQIEELWERVDALTLAIGTPE